MNSASARSNAARSEAGWLAIGTAAKIDTALIRTPRLGSERSGETIGQIRSPERPSSMSSAAIRTIGSGSANPLRASSMFAGETPRMKFAKSARTRDRRRCGTGRHHSE